MTHDDFLRAIIDNPEDDGPRLVYSDFLDERGDPRGEFIRVQCERARLAEEDPRAEDLAARERELLGKYEEVWLGPVRGLTTSYEFRRGFIEFITLRVDELLRHAAGILAGLPLREVLLTGVEVDPQLATCPYLRRLTSLNLFGCGLGNAGLRQLLTSPHLRRLRKLGLAETGIDRLGLCELVVRSDMLPELTDLDLSYNDLGAAAVTTLASSSLASRLQGLTLGGLGISSRAVRALTSSHSLAGLTTLDLRINYLGDVGARALTAATCWRGVCRLDLSDNGIGVRGVCGLVRSELWPNLMALGLSWNPIGDAGAEELLAAPRPPRMSQLELQETGISEPLRQALRERFGQSVCDF